MSARAWLPGAAAFVLLASIVTLAGLFLVSVDQAGRLFERAALSQAQAGDVLALHAAAQSGDPQAVATALRRYRDDLARETALVGSDRLDQQHELAAARSMAMLAAGRPARLDLLAFEVAQAAARERGEAGETARRMADLRSRTQVYALMLSVTALGSAVLGAWGLRAANRRLADAVAVRTAQLEAVDASRRLFFAKVSHELRTPVTVMRGEAEVALATTPDDRAALATALDEVVTQSEQLDHRIAELLALSQAEDGRLELEKRPTDLTEVVRQAVARSERLARSNGVTLSVGDLAPATMCGDARWLEQAVVAVLDNAVKFSPAHGAVDITLSADGGSAVLSVADRGRGALPEALPRLFDAYYQTEDGRTRGGSGLGLALVGWVIGQHGGTARAAMRDGGGYVVVLRLPVAA
ncbi:sensor histidine kinase [Sphingomonas sp.]|uniref:sensor histidine kinase n=1 Tax=Sphingomonas sp. TaxID=28214 RepID=UPI0035C81994